MYTACSAKEAEMGHLVLWSMVCFYVALRPRKRDGLLGTRTEREGDERVKARPRIPWTAARTMEVLRRCPLAIAQRLVHCVIAVSTAMLGQSHKDNVRCTAVEAQSERSPTFAAQLHLPAHDLFWANLRVQLHLPPLDLSWNPI